MKVEYIKLSNTKTEAFVNNKKVADINKHALGYEIWFVDGDTIGYPTMSEAKREIESRYTI